MAPDQSSRKKPLPPAPSLYPRLVFVSNTTGNENGCESSLLAGDPFQKKLPANEQLPALLAVGWTIISVEAIDDGWHVKVAPTHVPPPRKTEP